VYLISLIGSIITSIFPIERACEIQNGIKEGVILFCEKEKLERRKFLNYLAAFHYSVPLKKDNGASGSDAIYQGLSLTKSLFLYLSLSHTHTHKHKHSRAVLKPDELPK